MFLVLTLFLSISHAQELWKSLSPIGKGSFPTALNIVEDYSTLFHGFVFNHQLDDHTELVFNKIKRHTFELNSKKLYRTLKPKKSYGRYLHGSGTLKSSHYFFSVDDKTQKNIKKGDFGSTQLIYEANLREDSPEDIYDMFIGYNFYLKNITYKNIINSLFDLKDRVELDLSGIDKSFENSFPHIKARFNDLAHINFKGKQTESHLKTKVEMNIDMDALKKYQYGYIYRYLNDLSDIFIGEIRLYDKKAQLLGVLNTNSARKRVGIEMAFGENFFLPLDPKLKSVKTNLLSHGENNFKLVLTGTIKIFDIGFDIKKYVIPIRYSYDPQMSSFHFDLSNMPQLHIHGTKLTGPVVSFLKSFLSIEDKINGFFKVLSQGMNTPSYLTLSYFNQSDITPESFYFKSNLSILDNTLLKMGFKLISKRILPDEFEKDEILTLTKEFHHAFTNDFKRAKRLLITEL